MTQKTSVYCVKNRKHTMTSEKKILVFHLVRWC